MNEKEMRDQAEYCAHMINKGAKCQLKTEDFGAVADNSWYERKELPPVGTECDYYWHERPLTWRPGVILSSGFDEDKKCVCIKVGEQLRICSTPGYFRPKKSEREKTIEAALAMDCKPQEGMLSRHDFCGVLFDAGLLKLPNEN